MAFHDLFVVMEATSDCTPLQYTVRDKFCLHRIQSRGHISQAIHDLNQNRFHASTVA